MNETHTLSDAMRYVRAELSPQYPKGEIEGFIRIICREVLGYESVDILLHKDSALSDYLFEKFAKVVEELKKNKPIQYIFGNAYFHGHEFRVNEHTLIPRPETEELVDMIIDQKPQTDLDVLDIGTGSGCIAISLALALRFPNVEAIDISEGAIAMARLNAAVNKCKVKFYQADILVLKPVAESYDIIVSNPPYIADSERQSMDANVLDYEPHTALFVPDSDPLRFYRTIAEYAVVALKPGGRLYFEINSSFSDEMRNLLSSLHFEDIELYRDMQGLYRFAVAKKNNADETTNL